MKIKQILAFLAALLAAIPAFSDEYPTISPTATYTDSSGSQHVEQAGGVISEQAPLTVRFEANPQNTAGLVVNYQWSVYLEADTVPDIVRYDEWMELTFTTAGTKSIILKATFTDSSGRQTSFSSEPIRITISESKLDFPNAFSPNGDGINDTYKAKEGYQSIVEFQATIVNRWGQKIYSWDDPSGEWDGTFNGKPVKEGTYFVYVKAKGADGHEYHIRRDVNLLRGYSENRAANNP